MSKSVAAADPDLQIRGEGGVHPNPEIRWGGGGGGAISKKIFFGPLGPQFGLKIRGEGGPPGTSPGSATE